MSLLILVDDEPDVETLFCQQFRRDLRTGRCVMEFAPETKRKALEGRAEELLRKPIDFTVLRGEIEVRLGMAA